MSEWPAKRMEELCEITSSKRIFAADYVSEGVPFYRGKEITEKYKGNLDVSTELFISEEKFTEIERKFGAPRQGDLLLTSVGTLGSPYVVKPGERFYFRTEISLGFDTSRNSTADSFTTGWFPRREKRNFKKALSARLSQPSRLFF